MGDQPQNERRNVIGRVYKPGTRLPDSQILGVVQLAKFNNVRDFGVAGHLCAGCTEHFEQIPRM